MYRYTATGIYGYACYDDDEEICTTSSLVIPNPTVHIHIVGSIVLNHADTKRGHLHAGIVPWCRGKGYGTVMLSLALAECQKKGILKVHICPNSKENTSAIRTILKNGGYLLEQSAQDGVEILRYEIDLSAHRN